jgi:hypothetical protein
MSQTTPPVFQLDPQQIQIIQAIQNKENIYVNAVFGSGKTTTILNSIQNLTDKQFVMITYNTHLKNEVLQKVETQGLSHIQVHTYHSLSMKYFGFGKNDEELQLVENLDPKIPIPEFETVFIDEIQDMTFILFKFIQKFLKHLPKNPQLVICGDHLQGVYQFKGADKRFLTLAPQIYQRSMIPYDMSTSYRLTHPMGWFINQVIYGTPILQTKKQGPPLLFFNSSPYKCIYDIVKYIGHCIKTDGLKAEDIFILSPSLKCGAKAPLKRLENLIFEKLQLPIYFCTNEDRELNDKVIQGKVVFSTFHQSKGRERKLVVVFGFDESYFEFYAKDEDRNECPSTLIVALTRAKQRLVIVKDIEKKPLPFMKKTIQELSKCKEQIQMIGSICDYEQSPRPKFNLGSYRKISVTDFVKFIKPEIQNQIVAIKDQLFEKKSEIKDDVQLDPIIDCQELSEDVSDLIGLLIPSIFEERQNGTSSIKEYLAICLEEIDDKTSLFMKDKLDKIQLDSQELSDLLYMIKVYKSIHVGIYSPFQIQSDAWLKKEDLERILKNIEFHIHNRLIYECDFHETDSPVMYEHAIFGNIWMTGRMDSLDRDYVWEFKCVRELSLEHFLQVVCYRWLWKLCLEEKYGNRKFRLVNIRTGEMYELKEDWELVEKLIDQLIHNQFEKLKFISDEEFIETCRVYHK